ncbi:uncharacterized protein LOC119593405 [Penaeus monodon]|uniref:uncharacterized protein LOC119593405 n=1 Tax=Penaeus monodon TaxID=6687 RepID=UPI0018A72526|nr:uncharacterized protein LOC119593405 [Penaeus monodon]XP_037798274.1 uncharacterized protein LOC119593405 [Penaeus monodon]
MEYPTKDKLALAEHPVTPAPGSSEASAAQPGEEEYCCSCCSYRTGSITVAILYLVGALSFLGVVIGILCSADVRDIGAVIFVLLGVLTVSIIFISLMFYGVVKRRPHFLLPWAIWEGFNIGVGVAGLVVSLFTVGVTALAGLVILSIRCYCLFVVQVYRGQLIAQLSKSEVNAQA